jgi:hypothetical protein
MRAAGRWAIAMKVNVRGNSPTLSGLDRAVPNVKKVEVVRITIDSQEPLEHVLRVVSAVYGRTLIVEEEPAQPGSSPVPEQQEELQAPQEVPAEWQAGPEEIRETQPEQEENQEPQADLPQPDQPRARGRKTAGTGRARKSASAPKAAPAAEAGEAGVKRRASKKGAAGKAASTAMAAPSDEAVPAAEAAGTGVKRRTSKKAASAKAAPSEETASVEGAGRARRTRRTSKATASAGGNGGVPAQRSLAQVRAWARENNKEVSTRGPIPAGLMAAYDEAHA